MNVVLLFMFCWAVIGCDTAEPPPESLNGSPASEQMQSDDETSLKPTRDGLDNDNDGEIDEPDEKPAATLDGQDNDNDGEIDEPDEKQ